MIRSYETAVVFDGTLSDDTIQKEQAQVEEFFKSNSEFEKVDVWGKRSLTYTINKKKMGYYAFFYYKAEGEVPGAFEKHIKLNDNILRHLTVVRDLKNDAAREALAARRERNDVERGDADEGGTFDDRDRDRDRE